MPDINQCFIARSWNIQWFVERKCEKWKMISQNQQQIWPGSYSLKRPQVWWSHMTKRWAAWPPAVVQVSPPQKRGNPIFFLFWWIKTTWSELRCCNCGRQLSVEIKEATSSVLAEGVAPITPTQHTNEKREWKSPACIRSSAPSVSFINSARLLARTLNTFMQPLWQEEGNSNKLALIFVSFFFRATSSNHFFSFQRSSCTFFFFLSLKLKGNKERRLFPFSGKFTVVFFKRRLGVYLQRFQRGFNQTRPSWGEKSVRFPFKVRSRTYTHTQK